MTQNDLEVAVNAFLIRPDLAIFSWHLGMKESRARRAARGAQQPDWLNTAR